MEADVSPHMSPVCKDIGVSTLDRPTVARLKGRIDSYSFAPKRLITRPDTNQGIQELTCERGLLNWVILRYVLEELVERHLSRKSQDFVGHRRRLEYCECFGTWAVALVLWQHFGRCVAGYHSRCEGFGWLHQSHYERHMLSIVDGAIDLMGLARRNSSPSKLDKELWKVGGWRV